MVLKKIDVKTFDKEKSIDFSKMHIASRIDLRKKPSRPPLALSIGVDDREYNGVRYPLKFASLGNLSLIKGEEKARKSFFKSMLMACAIGGNSNNYAENIKAHNLHGKYFVDFDTEQDAYDSWLNGVRIPKMVGIMPDNYEYISLREYSKKEIKQYLDWFYLESEYRNKIGFACLDGYADIVDNFNDNKECDDVVRRLMKYTTVSKSHLTGVLHLNPGTEKGRGHLGTMLQQKCEMVAIIKDHGEFSSVKCQRVRGSKKFKEFTIRIDDDWMPYVSNDEIIDEPQNILLR